MANSEQAAVSFCEHLSWRDALWVAVAYQFHPESKMPPLMGMVFDVSSEGCAIFQSWVDAVGNADENDDLRVAILEGDMPGQTEGYTVRLSPSLNEYLENGDEGRNQVGQVVRMHPQFGTPGSPDMLARFKQEYERHGEFMLAPVVQRDDDQLYMNIQQGIIKRELIVRHVSEIADDEPDMLALRQCDDEKVVQNMAARLKLGLEPPIFE